MRVISIFTDRSIKSISIKSILLIYIDLSIDKSISIFIEWLRRETMQNVFRQTEFHVGKHCTWQLVHFEGIFNVKSWSFQKRR